MKALSTVPCIDVCYFLVTMDLPTDSLISVAGCDEVWAGWAAQGGMPELPRPRGHPKEPCNQQSCPTSSFPGYIWAGPDPGSVLAKDDRCTANHGKGGEWNLGPGLRGVEGWRLEAGVLVRSDAFPFPLSPGELRVVLSRAGSWTWCGHGSQDEQEESRQWRGQEKGEAGEYEEGDGDCEHGAERLGGRVGEGQ